MRITNNVIRESALANMRRGLQQMDAATQRVTSGLRIQRVSDDPIAASSAMITRGSIRAVEQFRRASEAASMRLDLQENVLDNLGELLSRAQTLGISQATDTADASTRRITRLEVEGLLQHAVSLANTQLNGFYLFGGARNEIRPFSIDATGPTLDFSSADPTGAHSVEIAPNHRVPTNHDGTEIFGDASAGPLAALRDLARALETDDTALIGAALNQVGRAFEHVQQILIETGVRTNQLEMTRANLDAMEMNLLTLRSDLEDIDLEEAVTQLISRQNAFQAAMLATSRVMGLTLADYLR